MSSVKRQGRLCGGGETEPQTEKKGIQVEGAACVEALAAQGSVLGEWQVVNGNLGRGLRGVSPKGADVRGKGAGGGVGREVSSTLWISRWGTCSLS